MVLILLIARHVLKAVTSISKERINIYFQVNRSVRIGITHLPPISFLVCGTIVMTAASWMFINSMATWLREISQPWVIISGILLLTRPTGCICGISSGTFQANRMTCRVSVISAMEMLSPVFLLSIIYYMAIK